jgi:hypothetical protein
MTNSSNSASGGVDITPSDVTNINLDFEKYSTRGLYVGDAGDVSLVWGDGSVSLHANLPEAYIIRAYGYIRVNSTGTTASRLIAYYDARA